MGGFTYDRTDYSDSSSLGWSSGNDYSNMAASRMSASVLDASMKPNHRIESKTKHPIVIVLDVTGSNIDLARIVYDKAPMLYGQIEQQGYLDDFDICFMAVGDSETDKYPLQVGNFAKGIDIDTYLEKIVLEACGGGNNGESYEVAAYYLTHYMDLPDGAEPIIFFQGDEPTHGAPTHYSVTRTGIPDFNADSNDVWEELREICNDNVYMLLGKYDGVFWKEKTLDHWKDLLAKDHVIKVNEDKAVADLILGVISMVSNTRDLDSYKIDMINRGQTQKRIIDVEESLKNLSTSLAVSSVNTDITTTQATKKATSKAKRI